MENNAEAGPSYSRRQEKQRVQDHRSSFPAPAEQQPRRARSTFPEVKQLSREQPRDESNLARRSFHEVKAEMRARALERRQFQTVPQGTTAPAAASSASPYIASRPGPPVDTWRPSGSTTSWGASSTQAVSSWTPASTWSQPQAENTPTWSSQSSWSANSPTYNNGQWTPSSTSAMVYSTPVASSYAAPVSSSSSSSVSLATSSPTAAGGATSLPNAFATTYNSDTPRAQPTLFGTGSQAASSAQSTNSGTPLKHNVPIILAISIGSIILLASLICGLAWLSRMCSGKKRVHKRKRLDRDSWSPRASSSDFSFLEAEKALHASDMYSPLPALTMFNESRGKTVGPIRPGRSLPVVPPAVPPKNNSYEANAPSSSSGGNVAGIGGGYRLYDQPLPLPPHQQQGAATPSSVPSAHQAYWDQEGRWMSSGTPGQLQVASGYASDNSQQHQPYYPHQQQQQQQPYHGQWHSAPAAGGQSLLDRMSKPVEPEWEESVVGDESNVSAAQPVQHGNQGESSRRTLSGRSNVISTLSSTIMKATGRTGSAAPHDPSATSLGVSDSELPATRRLTKSDERFRCDVSTSEEDSYGNPSPLPALGVPAYLNSPSGGSTPGMAGVGAAFPSNPRAAAVAEASASRFRELQVNMVQVPSPIALFGADPMQLLMQQQQQQRLQHQFAFAPQFTQSPTDPRAIKLNADIARWQALNQAAGTPESFSDGSSSCGGGRRSHVGRHQPTAMATSTSYSNSTLYSPVTSISSASTLSVKGKGVAAALNARQSMMSEKIASSTMMDWLTKELAMSDSESEDGSAIVFDGSQKRRQLSQRSRCTSMPGDAGVTSRRSIKSATSATTSTNRTSIFDDDALAAEKKERRVVRPVEKRRRHASASAATLDPELNSDSDLSDIAEQIDEMLMQSREQTPKPTEAATLPHPWSLEHMHTKAMPTAQQADVSSPLTSSDSEVSTRRWRTAPVGPAPSSPFDLRTGRRKSFVGAYSSQATVRASRASTHRRRASHADAILAGAQAMQVQAQVEQRQEVQQPVKPVQQEPPRMEVQQPVQQAQQEPPRMEVQANLGGVHVGQQMQPPAQLRPQPEMQMLMPPPQPQPQPRARAALPAVPPRYPSSRSTQKQTSPNMRYASGPMASSSPQVLQQKRYFSARLPLLSPAIRQISKAVPMQLPPVQPQRQQLSPMPPQQFSPVQPQQQQQLYNPHPPSPVVAQQAMPRSQVQMQMQPPPQQQQRQRQPSLGYIPMSSTQRGASAGYDGRRIVSTPVKVPSKLRQQRGFSSSSSSDDSDLELSYQQQRRRR